MFSLLFDQGQRPAPPLLRYLYLKNKKYSKFFKTFYKIALILLGSNFGPEVWLVGCLEIVLESNPCLPLKSATKPTNQSVYESCQVSVTVSSLSANALTNTFFFCAYSTQPWLHHIFHMNILELKQFLFLVHSSSAHVYRNTVGTSIKRQDNFYSFLAQSCSANVNHAR